jgi:hypothetical protein
VTIGRDGTVNFAIDDPSVSRRHATTAGGPAALTLVNDSIVAKDAAGILDGEGPRIGLPA